MKNQIDQQDYDGSLVYVNIGTKELEAAQKLWQDAFSTNFLKYQYSMRLVGEHSIVIIKDKAGISLHEVINGSKKYDLPNKFYGIQVPQDIFSKLIQLANMDSSIDVICIYSYTDAKSSVPYIQIAI